MTLFILTQAVYTTPGNSWNLL